MFLFESPFKDCSLTKLKGQPVSQIPPKTETNYDNCSPQPSYVCTTWLCSLLICFILPAAAIRPHSTKDRRHHRIRSVCLLQVCNVCTPRGAIIMLAAKHHPPRGDVGRICAKGNIPGRAEAGVCHNNSSANLIL